MHTVLEPARNQAAPNDAANPVAPHDDAIEALLERYTKLARAHAEPLAQIALAVGRPFAAGAGMASVAEVEAARPIVPRCSASSIVAPIEQLLPATWAPPSSARIRAVEAIALAVTCAYFGIGLVRTLAGL